MSIAVAAFMLSGCATTAPDRDARMQRGFVWYLDGAGGGGITNWAGGVRDGLKAGGYDGAGEMFDWETGLGVVADQTASNRYKRGKAEKLAEEIARYRQSHPRAPITLMGMSAGTAVAVFTLEALPPQVMVDNVILLSGSLSATHDMTQALGHVRGKVYITTSHQDSVLGGLVPISGTADRGSGTTETIGVEGPRLPRGASAETRRLYAEKLVVAPWKPEWARYGNSGGHLQTVSAPFIEHYIAPLVKTTSDVQLASASARGGGTAGAAGAGGGTVVNPDFERWARFAPGSWVMLEGFETIDGRRRPLRMKVTLEQKSADRLVIRRDILGPGGALDDARFPQLIYASARIAPAEHPMTHPAAEVRELPNADVAVGARTLNCEVKSVASSADFHDWGSRPQATIHVCPQVPSGVAKIDIRTRFGAAPVTVEAQVTDFHIAGS